jgi:hypothetical protein
MTLFRGGTLSMDGKRRCWHHRRPHGETRMDFMKILKSLEEFLYEVMTWLVFYPRTMWLALRRPLTMMDYADSELHDRTAEQYTDTLSPPLFLVLTIILSHGVELALVGQSAVVTDTSGLSALISDDTNLIIFRAICFSMFPLMTALLLLWRQGTRLDRNTLRPPYYSQCYIAAPFALMTGIVTIMIGDPDDRVRLGAAAIMLGVVVWYLAIQTRWFAQHLKTTRLRALPIALVAYALALGSLGLVAPLFA